MRYEPTAQLRAGLAESIEFEFSGREFRIARVPLGVMDVVAEAQTSGGTSASALLRVIEAFIGAETMRELGEPDLREVLPLATWLVEQVSVGLAVTEKK
jgi:hypothetical protein